MAINQDVINPNTNWENQTKGYVEDGLKALLRAMLDVLENPTVASNSVGREQLTQAIRDAIDSIAGKVPNTRTVNGKALSQNITLNSSDVGAMPADAPVVKGVAVGENNPVTPDSNGIVTLPEGGSSQVLDTAMSNTSENAVQNNVIKAYVDAVSQTLNTLIGSGNVQGAIDTFNEVTAFLNGIDTDDPTLANQLLALNNAISVLQTSLATKANAADVPTKTSDLTNDSGYVTASALVDVVAGNGDFAMTYDDVNETYNIVRVVAMLTVTQLAAMSANTKSGTFKVSGTHLKGDVTIALPQGLSGWLLSVNGGAGASSITLSPTDGTLQETIITVTYSGSTDSVGNAITISSNGVETQTVYATYTEFAGPTIIPAEDSLSLSEVAGYSDTKTLAVTGANLTEGITAALSGSGASKFSVSGTLTSSGGTLTIAYNPSQGDTGTHNATLTLSSAGAQSVTIALSGSVKTQTLAISPATLDLTSASGTSATGTVTVSGTNIKGSVSLSVGSGFTLDKNTLTATEVNAGATVTVTADTSSASGTLTATDGRNTATAAVTWAITEETPSVGDIITKGGLNYKVTALPSGSTAGTLKVVNGDGEDPSGYKVASAKYTMENLVIPSSITYAGDAFNVTEISDSAFADCINIKSVSFGDNLNKIGQYAFYNCPSTLFTSVSLNNVTYVHKQAFSKCTNLSDVIVTSTSLTIQQNAFSSTSVTELDLTSVISSLTLSNQGVPATVTRLDVGEGCSDIAGGTYSCSALSTLILRRTSGITACVKDGSGYTSFNARKTAKNSQGASYVPTKVYVPAELKATYEANANWADWVSLGVIEFDVIGNLPN